MHEAEKVRNMILSPALTAKKMGLAPGYTQQMARQWLRKLNRCCVICNEPVKGRELRHRWCKGVVLDPRPARTLLLQLDPYSGIVETKCAQCGRTFEITVKRAMRAFERGGIHKVDLCESCLLDRLKEPLRWTPFDTESMRELKQQHEVAAARVARKGGRRGRRKRKSTGGAVHGSRQGGAQKRPQ